jgi:hypothetical protein
MEIMLTRMQESGQAVFCEGLPLVPTLGEVASWLKSGRVQAAADAGADPPLTKSTVTDHLDPSMDFTFCLGIGKVMRITDRVTKQAMCAVGFLLYTLCAENRGDLWPTTMGAFNRLLD